MQIIGFGEMVRLEEGMTSKKEMRVLMPDGTEHGVVVPEEVVQRLLSLWVTHKRAAKEPTVLTKAPIVRPTFVEPAEEDVGEVRVAPAPAQPEVTHLPRPKFLEEDEDG